MLNLKGVVVVNGFQGAGKTLFMTKTAYELREKYNTIYANYHLNFPHEKLDLIELYINRQEIKNSIICIDEGQMFFNARNFMSSFSKMSNWFFNQTRKRGNLLMITTIPGQLDIDIRQRSAFFHIFPHPLVQKRILNMYKSINKKRLKRCDKYKDFVSKYNCIQKLANEYYKDADYDPEALSYKWVDPALCLLYDIPVKYFYVEVYNNPPTKVVENIIFDATEYYPLYDTSETIFPDWSQLKKKEKEKEKEKKKPSATARKRPPHRNQKG